MKKLLLFSILSLLIFACGGEESKIPKDISYSIIDEDRNDNIGKSNIKIRINKKTSKDVLSEIAKEIKREREELNNLFIFYYTEGMSTTGMAWATSHFTPNLEVKILGSTDKEDKKMLSEIKVEGEILGKWKSDVLMGAILIFYENNQEEQIMKIQFKDGSVMEDKITRKTINGKTRLDDGNENGEYYILDKDGNLSLYGNDGKFDEPSKI